MKKRTQQLFAFGFGVTFVVAMLILAIAFPNPTPFQYTVFRVTLALATAGVAAMIPGFIEIELPNWLRAGGALAVFVMVYFYNPASLVAPPAEKSSATAMTCTVEAKVVSDVVSRVFFRDAFRPEQGEQTLQPTSQELFYEWQVLLSANETAQDISLELHQLQADDRIAIDPTATGVLSEPSKRWYSGFPEPHRSKPDYLLRTVRFSHLSPSTPAATVTIRRFLTKPLLSSNDLIKIGHATASNCQVKLEEVGQAQDVKRLQRFAKTLAENVYQMNETGSPVPLRSDPGDLAEREIQGTIELRCKNELCSERIAGRFEGRMGKSPGQYVQERGVQKLTQLKEALGEFFSCIKEPYDDTHPTHETLILEGCGPALLSPEELQRVLSVMEKHGFKTDIMPPSQPNQGMEPTR